ncbi:DUF6812 domain-containing protein [Leptodesmis sp.]|uniref:DUF6812 domain-containing protein n=1 Tax=Leptodesmis sp. TaxID=3100501 RepID=UPI00405347DF
MNPVTNRTIHREKQRVKIYTTDGWEIQGEVSIPAGGYNSRLSDFLNGEKAFIAITNAMVYGWEGSLLASESFISVNKQAIKLVVEDHGQESLIAEPSDGRSSTP